MDGRGPGQLAGGGARLGVVRRALAGERHPDHREQVAADGRLEIDAERRRRAELAQAAGDREPVSLQHFRFGREGERYAPTDHQRELRIRQRLAMDDVVVVAKQAFGRKPVPAVGRTRLPACAMHARNEAELARQAEILLRDFVGRVVRTEDRKAQSYQSVTGRQPFGKPLDLAARMRHVPERLLSWFGVGLRRAVEKGGADSRFDEGVDGAIGMVGRGIVVAPVDQRGRAAVDLVKGADQCGDVDVLRAEFGGKPRVHMMKIFEDRPVSGHAAKRSLPGVLVRVDEAGQHDAARGFNDFRMRRRDLRRNFAYAPVFDQHIAPLKVADARVHADDASATDECCGHGYLGTRPSLTLTFSGLSVMPAALASSSSSTEKSTSS